MGWIAFSCNGSDSNLAPDVIPFLPVKFGATADRLSYLILFSEGNLREPVKEKA